MQLHNQQILYLMINQLKDDNLINMFTEFILPDMKKAVLTGMTLNVKLNNFNSNASEDIYKNKKIEENIDNLLEHYISEKLYY